MLFLQANASQKMEMFMPTCSSPVVTGTCNSSSFKGQQLRIVFPTRRLSDRLCKHTTGVGLKVFSEYSCLQHKCEGGYSHEKSDGRVSSLLGLSKRYFHLNLLEGIEVHLVDTVWMRISSPQNSLSLGLVQQCPPLSEVRLLMLGVVTICWNLMHVPLAE
eukprot:Gb_26574 [translate_table: standard]